MAAGRGSARLRSKIVATLVVALIGLSVLMAEHTDKNGKPVAGTYLLGKPLVRSSTTSKPDCVRCQAHTPDRHRAKRFALLAAKPANNNSGNSHGNSNNAGNNRDASEALLNGMLMDSKMTENVTNSLNDMAQNFRRMFMENRQLQSQLQDVFGRLQNVTGVNATSVVKNMPKNTNGLVNGVMNRLQQQPKHE